METIMTTPKIKICGITSCGQAQYLAAEGADYAGLVFYEKSRRNVSFREAEQILGSLPGHIRRVAVTVSPTADLAREVRELGFDILQVHGKFSREAAAAAGIPIWRAVNIDGCGNFAEWEEMEGAVAGYVADGAGYGGGKPFDWNRFRTKIRAAAKGKMLILAGGLTPENVAEGIRAFAPDVVDVSSGVEENGTKSREKIREFIRKVREQGRCGRDIMEHSAGSLWQNH